MIRTHRGIRIQTFYSPKYETLWPSGHYANALVCGREQGLLTSPKPTAREALEEARRILDTPFGDGKTVYADYLVQWAKREAEDDREPPAVVGY